MARIGTRPDQVLNAASLARALLREVPLSRFEEARQSTLVQLRAEHVSFRRIPSSVLSWRLRGLSKDPRPAWIEGLERLEREPFEAWVCGWRETSITTTIVGDLSGVDTATLAPLGAVETLTLRDVSTR